MASHVSYSDRGEDLARLGFGDFPEVLRQGRSRLLLFLSLVLLLRCPAVAQQSAPSNASIYLDFSQQNEHLLLRNGLGMVTGRFGSALEFTTPLHLAELGLTKRLEGAQAATVCAWVMPRRSGEQYFVARGLPETGANGERFFRREETW